MSTSAVVTLFDSNYQDIADVCLPNIREYCDHHNFDLIIHRDRIDKSRYVYWSKILAVHNALSDWERVFWIDIDSLFCNKDFDVFEKYGMGENYGVINKLHRKPKDITECQYSVSQMIFTQGSVATELLPYVYDQTQYLNHVWPEQMALISVMEEYPTYIFAKEMARIYDPIDYLYGKDIIEVHKHDMVTVGGGPGAKPLKIDSLKQILAKIPS